MKQNLFQFACYDGDGGRVVENRQPALNREIKKETDLLINALGKK